MAAKKAKRKDPSDDATPDFEESLEELEVLVRRLEDGRLGLSESLECYEQGVKRLKTCYLALEKAERKIELLAGVDSEGNPITEPLDDTELTLQQKADSRSKRRSQPKPENDETSKPGELF